MIDWLAKATYPTRDGAHMNSAFGLMRAWSWSEQDDDLRAAISTRATGWYADDRDYPIGYEPGGADFLSGALTEAELMHAVLPEEEFGPWFAERSCPTRRRCTNPPWSAIRRRVHHPPARAESVPGPCVSGAGRTDRGPRRKAGQDHLDASLPSVIGGDWMAEHWLAAYAILALT